MLLMNFKETGSWIYSEWHTCHPMGWENICRAVSLTYGYFRDPVVLTSIIAGTGFEEQEDVRKAADVFSIPETGQLIIRGKLELLGGIPVQVILTNQTKHVSVHVMKLTDEFKETDYEKLTRSLHDYLTSMEIAMYDEHLNPAELESE